MQFVNISVCLLPVIVFLAALLFVDSFKLVSARRVLGTILAGATTALVALLVNDTILGLLSISSLSFSRYVAPVVEELLKAAYVIYLIRSNRIGFMVDGAIYGFAVGTGFALVENVYYLSLVSDPNTLLWILRGFGTAAMHGGATAVFAILSKHLTERTSSVRVTAYIPGILIAVLTHSLFNHFVLPPIIMTALLIVTFMTLVVVVFERSEHATRNWLGEGLDTDMETWEIISSGRMSGSRIGKYLESLTSHFPPAVVADMLCYLQLHIELGIQAKGILLAKEAGVKLEPDKGLAAKLRELKFLEASMGKTGYLTIKPFVHNTEKSIWQLRMLEG